MTQAAGRAGAVVDQEALAVRPPVTEPAGHPGQQLPVHRPAVKVDHSGQAAHQACSSLSLSQSQVRANPSARSTLGW